MATNNILYDYANLTLHVNNTVQETEMSNLTQGLRVSYHFGLPSQDKCTPIPAVLNQK